MEGAADWHGLAIPWCIMLVTVDKWTCVAAWQTYHSPNNPQ